MCSVHSPNSLYDSQHVAYSLHALHLSHACQRCLEREGSQKKHAIACTHDMHDDMAYMQIWQACDPKLYTMLVLLRQPLCLSSMPSVTITCACPLGAAAMVAAQMKLACLQVVHFQLLGRSGGGRGRRALQAAAGA